MVAAGDDDVALGRLLSLLPHVVRVDVVREAWVDICANTAMMNGVVDDESVARLLSVLPEAAPADVVREALAAVSCHGGVGQAFIRDEPTTPQRRKRTLPLSRTPSPKRKRDARYPFSVKKISDTQYQLENAADVLAAVENVLKETVLRAQDEVAADHITTPESYINNTWKVNIGGRTSVTGHFCSPLGHMQSVGSFSTLQHCDVDELRWGCCEEHKARLGEMLWEQHGRNIFAATGWKAFDFWSKQLAAVWACMHNESLLISAVADQLRLMQLRLPEPSRVMNSAWHMG